MLMGYLIKDLLCLAPVTFKSDQNRYLIPDVLEPLAVIGQNFIENLAIWDVDNASGALVGVDPVANLHQAEHKDTLVNDISTMVAKLDSIANLERLPPEYEGPPGEIDQWSLQGNGQTCGEQAEISRYGLKAGKPDAANHQKGKGVGDVGDTFPDAVLYLNVTATQQNNEADTTDQP